MILAAADGFRDAVDRLQFWANTFFTGVGKRRLSPHLMILAAADDSKTPWVRGVRAVRAVESVYRTGHSRRD